MCLIPEIKHDSGKVLFPQSHSNASSLPPLSLMIDFFIAAETPVYWILFHHTEGIKQSMHDLK